MNKEQRSKIAELQTELESVSNTLLGIQSKIQMLSDTEREKLENLPENLEGSSRYDAIETSADALEDAVDEMDAVLTYLEHVGDYLDDAL